MSFSSLLFLVPSLFSSFFHPSVSPSSTFSSAPASSLSSSNSCAFPSFVPFLCFLLRSSSCIPFLPCPWFSLFFPPFLSSSLWLLFYLMCVLFLRPLLVSSSFALFFCSGLLSSSCILFFACSVFPSSILLQFLPSVLLYLLYVLFLRPLLAFSSCFPLPYPPVFLSSSLSSFPFFSPSLPSLFYLAPLPPACSPTAIFTPLPRQKSPSFVVRPSYCLLLGLVTPTVALVITVQWPHNSRRAPLLTSHFNA